MSRLKNDSGQALALVMMVTLVILLMSLSVLTQGTESRKASFEERRIVQACYIAEAGAEKAIAEIKNNPLWLKGLTLNTDYTFISAVPYAGGQITSVKVKRITKSANPTRFFVESLGEYQGAKRTIQVQGEMYDPVDFSRGLWLRSSLSQFGQNSTVDSDIVVEGAITFENNCSVLRNITAAEDVTILQNMTAAKITTAGNLLINNNARAIMDVDAAGDVILDNNTQINGVVNAVGNVSVGSGAMIGYETGDGYSTVFHGKDVYFNGIITNNGQTGTQHPGEAHAVNVSLPSFPTLEQSWYAENADRILTGRLTGMFYVDGISYVSGDISISGIYSGAGAIVAGGKVTINGDLTRADTNSSLAIISFGSPAGIEVGNNLTVHALLYTPDKVSIGDGTHVYGSVVCNVIDIGQGATLTGDDTMQNNQPKWITTAVSITSWKEKYSVF